MADQEINIKLNGLAQIRSELKALKGELANATDPTQMAELAARAGELSDKLKDANEKAAIFATGSKFEATTNAFAMMQGQIDSLDFEGAAESANLFASNLKSINPKDIGNSIKALGSSVMTVGKAFVSFGVSLLANPIFLIATIIAGVVAAFVYLGNKLGWFEDIIKMLTATFKPLIDMIKWLMDALGITSFAAEESLKKTNEQLQKEKEKREEVLLQMDNKIALLEAEGKSTVALRIEKNKYFQEELGNQAKLLEFMNNSFLNQTQLYKETVKENKQKTQEIKVEEIKLNQELKAEQKKSAEDYKAFLADRLAATRLIQDITLGLMQDGIEKELKANQYKYERLQEDLLKNEKFNEKERIALNALYEKEAEQTATAINKKYTDAEAKKQADLAKVIKDAKEIQAQEEEDFFTRYQEAVNTQQQNEINAVREKYNLLIAEAERYGQSTLELEQKQAKELKKIQDAADEELRQKRLKEQSEKIQIAQDYTNSINNLAETAFALADRFGKQDEVNKEKRAKRQFAVQKAMQLSLAIIDGFKAAQASIAQFPPVTPIGIAALVATISASVANIAKIASTQYGSKSTGGGGGGGTDVTTSAQNAGGGAPSFSLFGQGNNMNTTSSPQDVEKQSNQLTVKAVVVESDVTSTQNKIKKMQENATL